MARGSEAKEIVTAKILETFPGSFKYDKELRVPIVENGETLQIKVTLTCAKTNVDGGDGSSTQGVTATATPAVSNFMNEPTAQEKQAVATLCEKLGLTT